MRFIGVQFKINDDDFKENFSAHVENFYRKTDPEDFIIFPEDIGLLTAFSGLTAQSTIEAMQVLYSRNQDVIDAIVREKEIQNFTTAIFLSLTSKFISEFYNLFSSLSKKYSVYTLSCNNMPPILRKGERWEFTEARVYNSAFVFGTSGELLFKQDKVFLTSMELDLGISGGKISQTTPFKLGNKNIGIAISLDAFMPQYLSRLEDADIIIQPDANPGKWNCVLGNGRWQPEEWMDSAYYIAQRIGKVGYVINPMMVGNLFEVRFEGQSSITKKAEETDTKMSYIGNLPSTGFQSILGIPGYDVREAIDRESVSDRLLKYEEGVIEIEL